MTDWAGKGFNKKNSESAKGSKKHELTREQLSKVKKEIERKKK